jgi:hypothetical protein
VADESRMLRVPGGLQFVLTSNSFRYGLVEAPWGMNVHGCPERSLTSHGD